MTRDKQADPDVVHVFDQTNGVVDLGTDDPSQEDLADGRADAERNRTLDGIAAISVKTH